jgi:hypothetical protein
VPEFLALVDNPQRRADGEALCEIMSRLSGHPPVMWGPSIIGFDRYTYLYDSGHGGDMCRIGFSPRKAELVLYVLVGAPQQDALLARLGKHKTGKVCLYIRRLSDIDLTVLEQLIAESLAEMRRRYP